MRRRIAGLAELVPETIPIVFAMGGDPIKLGMVASLARPGDNITGVAFLLSELAPKQVELLHEIVPKAAVIGFLVDPSVVLLARRSPIEKLIRAFGASLEVTWRQGRRSSRR